MPSAILKTIIGSAILGTSAIGACGTWERLKPQNQLETSSKESEQKEGSPQQESTASPEAQGEECTKRNKHSSSESSEAREGKNGCRRNRNRQNGGGGRVRRQQDSRK